MYSWALVLAFTLALDAISQVKAGLYVIKPSQGETCHANEDCTVQWLDDGKKPLVTELGVTTVGLYTANQQLVQSIDPVDVSKAQSFTFKPIPDVGPDSNTYYIAFTSISATNNGTAVLGFSPFFQLDGMSGSFSSPIESATSSISIPSSLTGSEASQTTPLSTVTVGPPLTSTDSSVSTESITSSSSTSTAAPTTDGTSTSAPTSSGFSTLVVPSSSSSTAKPTGTTPSGGSSGTSAAASTTQSSNGASKHSGGSIPFLGVLSLYVVLSSLV